MLRLEVTINVENVFLIIVITFGDCRLNQSCMYYELMIVTAVNSPCMANSHKLKVVLPLILLAFLPPTTFSVQ